MNYLLRALPCVWKRSCRRLLNGITHLTGTIRDYDSGSFTGGAVEILQQQVNSEKRQDEECSLANQPQLPWSVKGLWSLAEQFWEVHGASVAVANHL